MKGPICVMLLIKFIFTKQSFAIEYIYEEYVERCDFLPPKPSKLNEDIPLTELLNQGSFKMAENGFSEDVTLLMGIPGSGKSELSRILSTPLSQLYIVRTHHEKLVLIDNQVDISIAPPAYEELVPSLIPMLNESISGSGSKIENQTMTYLYNCPSFVATHGKVQDVAANFFMHQVFEGVSRVKFLFILSYFSTPKDLDYLIGNATTLIENLGKYNKSIGLVVTQVPQSISQPSVIPDIESFLNNYKNSLTRQLSSQSTSNVIKMATKKIELVNILLEKDRYRNNFRIMFTNDINKNLLGCGMINNLTTILPTRARIDKFITNVLQFTIVHSGDFNFTLEIKDWSRLALKNVALFADNMVADIINGIMNHFYHNYIELLPSDLSTKLEMLNKTVEVYEVAMENLNNLNSSSNPSDFLKIIYPSLLQLDYVIDKSITQLMMLQQSYLEFDDKINPPGVQRDVRYWVAKFVEVLFLLKEEKVLTEHKIETKEKDSEIKRLNMEIELCQGNSESWRKSEMELLENMKTLLIDLNQED